MTVNGLLISWPAPAANSARASIFPTSTAWSKIGLVELRHLATDRPINKCRLSLRQKNAAFAERKATNREIILRPILGGGRYFDVQVLAHPLDEPFRPQTACA